MEISIPKAGRNPKARLRVYEELLQREQFTTRTIADAANVAFSTAYKVIDKFCEFVYVKRGDELDIKSVNTRGPDAYVHTLPEDSFSQLLQAIRDFLIRNHQQFIERLGPLTGYNMIGVLYGITVWNGHDRIRAPWDHSKVRKAVREVGRGSVP